jgi:hypothetical protein
LRRTLRDGLIRTRWDEPLQRQFGSIKEADAQTDQGSDSRMINSNWFSLTKTAQLNRFLHASVSIPGLLLFLLAVPAMGDDLFWKDGQGNRLPDTAFRKSVNGVGGWLLVTPDDDWEAKWNTSPDTVPHFTEAHTVMVGKRLRILTFIGNPMQSSDGARITCDFSVQKPDGTYSTQKQDLECLTGTLSGTQSTIYLSRLIVGFVGETADPFGKWIIRVTIKDLVKHAIIPLETSFVLQ